MNIDELFDQHRAKRVFEKAQRVRQHAPEDVELIEFTFSNVVYNKNRIREERQRLSTKTELPESMVAGLRNSVSQEAVEIPFPLEADIVLFELHGFLFNCIRTLNFLVNFTVEHIQAKHPRKLPSVVQFSRRAKKSNPLIDLFKQGYKNWFGEVNTLRNQIAHRNVVELMSAKLLVEYNTNVDGVKREAHISLESDDIEIPDVCAFCDEVTDKLEAFIIEFFRIVDALGWEPGKYVLSDRHQQISD